MFALIILFDPFIFAKEMQQNADQKPGFKFTEGITVQRLRKRVAAKWSTT